MNVKYKDINRYGINKIEKELYNKSLSYNRHNHLWKYVIAENNILCAIKIIKSNSGSKTPGPDNLTMNDILRNDINVVIKEVKNRLYGRTKGKARKVEIPKSDGKMRGLGIANIYDRIAQQCIKNILEPIVESQFNPESFGFRRNRNAQECASYIATSIQFNNDGHIYDCDLKSYFDTVKIDKVLDKLKLNHKIYDLQFLKCIKRLMWIDLVNPSERYRGIGLRQGSILGPILANVMFHDFELKLNEINDHKRVNGRDIIQNPNIFKNFGKNYKRGREFYFNWLQNRRVIKIIRYADDFVLISKGKYDIYDGIIMFKDWCIENDLEINEDKTKLIKISDEMSLEFLGYKISKKKSKENSFIIAPKNQKKIWKEVKNRIDKSLFYKNTEYLIVYLRGIFQYYDICTNLTWLINRISLYLILLMKRKRKFGNRIKYIKLETTCFMLNDTLLDLWSMRKYTVKSTKQYMLTVHEFWEPNNEQLCKKDWLDEYFRNKIHGNRNSSLIIYLPSLINQFKKEPILNIPYYEIEPEYIQIHHKIARCSGGKDVYSNLVPLCNISHRWIHSINLSKEELPDNINIKNLNKYRKLCGMTTV